jgi:hypothetical protein
MRAKHTALILTAGFLLIPTLSWSQFPGGRDGGGGRTRMMMDPDQLFDTYSRDGRTLRKEDLPQSMQMAIDIMGPQLGLTGTQWTREQLKADSERVRERIAQGGFNFGRGGPGGGPGALNFQMPGGRDGGMFPGGGLDGGDRRIEEYFKRLDDNEDGFLENEELHGDQVAEQLAAERDKYDLNHDGFIDFNEFRTYYMARRGMQDGNFPGRLPGSENERRRPTLIRAGNLPRDFPYANLDIDADGQIGLYEWKNSGNRINEFVAMDLNKDGFLTVEEYFGWRMEKAKESGSSSTEFARGSRSTMGLGIMEQGGRGFNGGQSLGLDPRTMAMGQFGSGFDRGRGGDRGPGSFGGDRGPGSFGGDRGRGDRGPGSFGFDRSQGGFAFSGDRGPGSFGGDRGPGGDRMRGPSSFSIQLGGPSAAPSGFGQIPGRFGQPSSFGMPGNGMNPTGRFGSPQGSGFGTQPSGFNQPMGPGALVPVARVHLTAAGAAPAAKAAIVAGPQVVARADQAGHAASASDKGQLEQA